MLSCEQSCGGRAGPYAESRSDTLDTLDRRASTGTGRGGIRLGWGSGSPGRIAPRPIRHPTVGQAAVGRPLERDLRQLSQRRSVSGASRRSARVRRRPAEGSMPDVAPVALPRWVVVASVGRSCRASAIMFSDARTPARCGPALGITEEGVLVDARGRGIPPASSRSSSAGIQNGVRASSG